MLLAASLADLAFAPPAPVEADRYQPVPPAKLTLSYKRRRPVQGGQRVHVTIPMTPGTNAHGDVISYRWDTGVDGGPRCQPGALPDLSAVTAGTVIDAPLRRPPGGWCRGSYGVALEAVIKMNCGDDPYCDPDEPYTQQVASASFEVGKRPRSVCRDVGEAERCRYEGTYREPASWGVYALLDDLLGPDGATSEADPYFERAFRHEPSIRDDWETDDNTFYGFPDNGAEATLMAKIVDRVLRSGPYYEPTSPARPRG